VPYRLPLSFLSRFAAYFYSGIVSSVSSSSPSCQTPASIFAPTSQSVVSPTYHQGEASASGPE